MLSRSGLLEKVRHMWACEWRVLYSSIIEHRGCAQSDGRRVMKMVVKGRERSGLLYYKIPCSSFVEESHVKNDKDHSFLILINSRPNFGSTPPFD